MILNNEVVLVTGAGAESPSRLESPGSLSEEELDALS